MKTLRGVIGATIVAAFLSAGCGETTTSTAASANAGGDQEVLVGESAALDGQSSTGVLSSSWSFTSRPSGSSASLTDSRTLTPSFTPDVAGTYVAELSINDGAATDAVNLTARNVVATISVPSGSALTTRTRFNTTEYVIDAGESGAILSAEGSRGAAALTLKNAAIASYSWEQVSGPAATATNGTTSSTLQFTAPTLANFLSVSDRYKWQLFPISRNDTRMVFKVTVTDAGGNTDTATFTVYVENESGEIHRSSGLPNVGIGTPVILSGPNLDASGASTTDTTKENGDAITDWSWTLSVPSGSSATFSDSGTTTSSSQFPSFTPDVAGLYTISYSSTTGNSTSTVATVKTPGTLTISAANYVGVGTIGGTTAAAPQCATCHDGSIEADRVTGWGQTVHAAKFQNSMDTYAGLAPEPYLWEFHTVGYDNDASNNGFDDLALANNFTFPSDGLSWANFIANEPNVAKLASIQCENCHGPGSMHDGDPLRISYSFAQFGACGQCHIQEDEWVNSAHNSTGVAHGSAAYQAYWVTNAGCVRCHNAKGFDTYLEEGEEGLASMAGDTGAFPGVTCAACHSPHSATNAKQLRLAGNVTMIIDSSTVNAGKAAVCYSCHDGNYAYNETDCDTNNDGRADAVCSTTDATAIGYWRGGYHYGTQSPVLEGKGAITDLNGDGTADFTVDENSFHSGSGFILSEVTGNSGLSSTNDKCITCHMAAGPSQEEEGYQHLGGHAFKLRTEHGLGHLLGGEEPEDTAATAGELELVSACTVCHASVTEMNREARADYDGDGSREGIQDEVKGLLLNLGTKILSLDTANISQTSGTTSSSGTITVNAISWAGSKSSGLTATADCDTGTPTGGGREVYQPCNFIDASTTLRRAVWNYNTIVRDGSHGIHNAAYVLQVLQGTYKALGVLLEGDAATSTYATDYTNATIR